MKFAVAFCLVAVSAVRLRQRQEEQSEESAAATANDNIDAVTTFSIDFSGDNTAADVRAHLKAAKKKSLGLFKADFNPQLKTAN